MVTYCWKPGWILVILVILVNLSLSVKLQNSRHFKRYLQPQWPVSCVFRISKGGEFSLATSAHTRGVKLSFPNFSYSGKKFFLPKGAMAQCPPKNATVASIPNAL